MSSHLAGSITSIVILIWFVSINWLMHSGRYRLGLTITAMPLILLVLLGLVAAWQTRNKR